MTNLDNDVLEARLRETLRFVAAGPIGPGQMPAVAGRPRPRIARRVTAVLMAAAILVVFFVPLPHVSLFKSLVAPAKVATPSPVGVVSGIAALSSLERLELAAANKAWAGVGSSSLPVLVGTSVQMSPNAGFTNGDTKLAFGLGRITAPTRFPSSPVRDRGWAVISAERALRLLKTPTPPVHPVYTGPPDKVLRVHLGTDIWETAHGRLRLPAWLFTVSGLRGTASVLALSPSDLFQPRHVSEPSPGPDQVPNVSVGSASLEGAGRTITIGFVGGIVGTTGCDDTYKARVVQEKAIVVVFVVETRVIPSGMLCSAVGYGDHLSVRLARPIGSRVLVDGASASAVPVPRSHAVPPTTKPLPVVDLSATPAGWVPVAYGDAQVSVPGAFSVFYPGQDPCESFSTPGALFVAPIPGFKRICPAPGHPRATLVRLVPYGGVPQKTAGEKLIIVNGVPAYFVPPSSAKPFISYFVPSLGVLVTGSGPMARRVLDTLTCSPRAVALASGGAAAVPSSWRSLTFAGLRFSVPASWPVQRTNLWNVCGPVQIAVAEGVTLDTDQVFQALPCPGPLPYAVVPSNGVRVDTGRSHSLSALVGSFSPGGTCLHTGGLKACPSSTPHYSVLLLRVSVPGRAAPVFVSIGLAGSGMVARTILYSLRAATPSEARASVGGTLVRVGGPAPGSAVALPGQVTAKNSFGHKFTVTVAKRGQFVLSIPAGVYELTGRSPMVTVNGAEMTCAATQPVRVKSGQETRGVEVICSIK